MLIVGDADRPLPRAVAVVRWDRWEMNSGAGLDCGRSSPSGPTSSGRGAHQRNGLGVRSVSREPCPVQISCARPARYPLSTFITTANHSASAG